VAAGTTDTDAVNVAQLKQVAESSGDTTRYVSINSTETGAGSNRDNDGATGTDAVAIGVRSQASGNESSAVGYFNEASGDFSSAVGYSNEASRGFSSAVGNDNTASGFSSSAVGYSNEASGSSSSAIGSSNKASKNSSSAVGYFNEASGGFSSAMGSNNTASGGFSSALGYINNASGILSSAVGVSNTASGNNSSAVGLNNVASGDDGSAVGRGNTASGNESSALGNRNTASGFNSSALGSRNTASESGATAVGSGSLFTQVPVVGAVVQAEFTAATTTIQTYFNGRRFKDDGNGGQIFEFAAADYEALGIGATASGIRATAIGNSSVASGRDSLAMGTGSTADIRNSIALGSQSVTTVDAGVAGFGADTRTTPVWQSTLAAVSVGDTSDADSANWQTRQITGVAAGTTDTDAVNVAQLKRTETNYSTALGGGASFGANGAFQAPTYRINKTDYSDVGSAFTAVDGRLTDLQGQITNIALTPGPKGDKGDKGETGPQGPAGQNGTDGLNGTNGVDGINGQNGTNGVDGVNGQDGADGTNGKDGVDGAQGLTGQDGIDGAKGDKGDSGISEEAKIELESKIEDSQARFFSVNGSSDSEDAGNYNGNGATADGAIAIGVNAQSKGKDSIAIGTNNTVTGDQSTSVGNGNIISGDRSGAFGDPNIVGGNANYAVGNDNIIGDTTSNSVVLGSNATVGATAVTVDTNSSPTFANETNASNSVAIGANSSVTNDNSVALGAGSQTSADNTVSVGSATNQRRITNVAAGVDSHDAVNLAQSQAGDSQTLDTANDYTNQRFATIDQNLNSFRGDVDSRFKEQDQRIDKVGAMSAAIQNMGTSVSGMNQRNRIGLGMGFQGGEQAVAIGYQRVVSDNTSLTFSGAFSDDESSAGVGVGFGW